MGSGLLKLFGAFLDDPHGSVLHLLSSPDEVPLDLAGEQGGAFASVVNGGQLLWHRLPSSAEETGAPAPTADLLPFRSATFDLVIEHRHTSTKGVGLYLPSRILEPHRTAEVRRVLRDGGGYAVIVPTRIVSHAGWCREACTVEPRAYSSLLCAAGLRPQGAFYVYPSTDNPRQLISTDRTISTRFFENVLAQNRSLHGRSGYLLRRLLIRAGLQRHLMKSTVIWSEK